MSSVEMEFVQQTKKEKKFKVQRDLNGRQEEIKREIDCENKSLGMKE
jgi:hypothetical protein